MQRNNRADRSDAGLKEQDIHLAQKFISDLQNKKSVSEISDSIFECSPNTAWALIVELSRLVDFRVTLKYRLNSNIKDNTLPLTIQLCKKAYTNQSYEMIIQHLLWLATLPTKTLNGIKISLSICLIYNLLKENEKFREQFKGDYSFLPFFSKEFFNKLIEYIHEQNETAVKDELLAICNEVAIRPMSDEMIREEIVNDLGFDKSALSSVQEDLITIAIMLTN